MKTIQFVTGFMLALAFSAGCVAGEGKVTHNHVKNLLADGKPVIGSRLYLPSPAATEVMARSGFDFLFIDLEHIALNPETVAQMVRAMKGSNAVPFVRLPGKDQWLAKLVLDIGAKGVVVPNVKSKEEAIDAVASVRYPPEGVRGIGPKVAADNWDLSVLDYLKVANKAIMAAVLIEHIDAVNRIDDILSVPGIDVVMVGPNDLAASMGLLGQLRHPQQEKAIQTVLDAAKKARIPAGTIATNAEDANNRIKQGFQLILISQDAGLLEAGAKAVLGQINR